MKNKTAIIFPGQGSQAIGMGKNLAENFSSAREVFAKVNEILGVNLSQIMFEGPIEELTKTEHTQPALMAVSIAIIEVLEKEFGKKFEDVCSVTAGHSLGEYSALCAAKSITLEDATKLLQIRGKSMAQCGENNQGAMAAILGVEIGVAEGIASKALDGYGNETCQVANDNSVGQVVISGSKPAILRAIEIAKEKGAKRSVLLPVSGAFHSQLMLKAQIEMKNALQKFTIKQPIIPVISNVTAERFIDENQIRQLLESQISSSVRWRETMLLMQHLGIERVVEVGSGKVLSGLVGRTCPGMQSFSIQNTEDIKNFKS